MAVYPKAVTKLIAPGPTDPKITPRVAILHVDAGNADSLYYYFRDRSGGVESHFFVKKDGTVEQYRDTDYQADANMSANDFAVSIETQGYGSGEWTAEQLASIKALLLWLRDTHGIPLVVCPRWDGSGVGYHILFMQEWAGGPRACPGPDRIKQFTTDLVPWMSGTTVAPPRVSPIVQVSRTVVRKVLRAALVVDGDLGPATIRQWQKVMGTPVDGVISKPSSLVKAVQRRVQVTPDGFLGPITWRAVQRRLGVPADGVAGPITIKALQRRLNANQF